MTDALYALLISGIIATIGALSGYTLGRSHGRASGYKRGLTIGSEGGRILAHMAASELVNRKEWPLDGRTNVQRWMELGRREAHAKCADLLCKRFNIETPQRKIEREV